MDPITLKQLLELGRQGEQGKRITSARLQRFLEHPEIVDKTIVISHFPFSTSLAPKGYTVIGDVEPSTFRVKDLDYPSFLEGGERMIGGEDMHRRAVAMHALGIGDANFILEHQDEIPESMQGSTILLAGTLLRDSDGYLHVAGLYWDGLQWRAHFGNIGYAHNRGCFARCNQKQKPSAAIEMAR